MKPILAFLLAVGAACLAGAAAAPARPNILIILSDDQGYDDLSSHGSAFAETPRLDRLAAQSLEFTRFYVEPACAPTRASLLTGRSFVRTGGWSVHFGGDYLALDETTFAERLRDAGYATGCFGKWHNGKSPGYLPADRGFQHAEIAELYAEIRARNVSHLRGTKGTIYEGGIRSPFMVRWPGAIRPGKTDVVAHVTDLFPTFLELAGAPAAPNAKPLDGQSLKSLLLGQPAALPARTIFGSELNIPAPSRAGQLSIRQGLDLAADRAAVSYATARLYARDQRFKLVKRGASRELFDLAADPEESTDVKEKFPADAKRLDGQLRAWFAHVLENDRPYQSPLYLVGRPDAPGAVVHFNGAHRLTGDFAGRGEWAHSLKASATGSSATFAVRVLAPGRYRAVLEADIGASGSRGTVSCGANRTSAALSAGGVHELGTLDVPAGASELVFTLEQTDPAAAPFSNFWNIVLLAAK